MKRFLILVSLFCGISDASELFTSMWWAEGPPNYLTATGPPPPALLCFHNAEFGFVFDAATLTIPHAGRIGSDSLFVLPKENFNLFVVRDHKTYSAVRGPAPKDEFFQPVQFIESGHFFQHVRIDGIQFITREGEKYPGAGAIEIAMWPDRCVAATEIDDDAEVDLNAGGALAKRTRRVAVPLLGGNQNRPTVEVDPVLKLTHDEDLACDVVQLPEEPWSNAQGTYYPEEHLDRVDRWRFTLRNDSTNVAMARLMFTKTNHLPITGFTPMLCDADGTPSGVPVQISKNWHQRPEKGHLAHEGPWFHGFTCVEVPPKTKRDFIFQMVYARYGGLPAVSHAQLSLIGWGHNQFWDESAIGSFGESICYEPGRVQRRCFIDDMRPLMTFPTEGGKPYGWAGNCGGGDFLVWFDENKNYRGFKATRTDYVSQGPVKSDVRYREETTGDEIAARMDVSMAQSDDYVRAFYHVRYDVKKPAKFSRLAFFQLGADYYNDSPERLVAIGNKDGLREEWSPIHGQDVYDRRSIPLTGKAPWVSIHGLERERLNKGSAAAHRGFIVRSSKARIGGRAVETPHFSTFCTEWGKGNFKTALELSPPPGVSELKPGDFIDTEIEIVIFPTDVDAYYGPNESFRAILKNGADTWRLVHREAAGNDLQLRIRGGKLVDSYPVAVEVGSFHKTTINLEGGIGSIPITVAGLKSHRGYEVRVNGNVNDFWQTDFEKGTWRQTFSVPAGAKLEFGAKR